MAEFMDDGALIRAANDEAAGAPAPGSAPWINFQGFLATPDNLQAIPIARMDLSESYNSGWRGQLMVGMQVRPGVSSANFMGSVMGWGVVPGVHTTVKIVIRSGGSQGLDRVNGTIVRTWPVMIGGMEPVETGEMGTVGCAIQIMDPVMYLGERPVWGAYRGCSVAEMIGGAMSMAAGGGGKPTLQPALPGVGQVFVKAAYRASLEWLHYAIAAGQPFGEWLADVVGLLGLRIEMLGNTDGNVMMYVTDMPPAGDEVAATNGTVTLDSEVTPVTFTGVYGQPAEPFRAAVLDDITQGGFRRIGVGSVGTVVSALGVDIDEVAARVVATAKGRYAERSVLSAASSQPGFRPGRVARFDTRVRGTDRWQVAKVVHRLRGRTYANALTLYDAQIPWAPKQPPGRPDVIVPAVIDAGEEYRAHAPVPRDRMGRIPIRFPFLPLETQEEADAAAAADAAGDSDGELTLGDFGNEFVDTAYWELEAQELAAGNLDDPYPGVQHTELNTDQLQHRTSMAERRSKARQYLLYKELKERTEGDRDHDGFVTRRDALLDDHLQVVLGDEEKRNELEEWHDSMLKGTLDETHPNLSEEERELVADYDRLFGPGAADSPDAEVRAAAVDAAAAAQKWPVRLPLPIVHPMAGGLHGFIPSHRQGDACRVAVHGPFSAEVIGFQYRDDRPISREMEDVTAGFVVEHDTGEAWSGILFRPTEETE